MTELPISRSGVGGFFFRLIGGGFHRGDVGVAGVRPDRGGVFALYNV